MGFDKDGSGFISATEIEQAAKEMTKVDMKGAETNGDGLVNYHEFENMVMIKMMFSELDKDGDGFITANEMEQATELLGRELTKEMKEELKGADTDGDRLVNIQEFEKMVKMSGP